MRFALITNGIVLNIIEADQAFIDKHIGDLGCGQAVECSGQYAGPGFTYANGVFIPPPDVEDDSGT